MDNKLKKILLISSSVFIIITIFIFIVFIYQNNRNPYGNELQIVNLNNYTKNKPYNKDVVYFIKHSLYNTVSDNLDKDIKSNSIDDILIRDKTFSQTFTEKNRLHSIKFIIDIQSLKQSYRVSYQWMDNLEWSRDLDEYGTMVTCLDKEEEIIYKDFKCKDGLSGQNIVLDPIVEYLPYSTPNYKITILPDEDKALNVKIYTSSADERIDPDAAILEYKSDVNKWIESIGLDPSEYIIVYEITRASLY